MTRAGLGWMLVATLVAAGGVSGSAGSGPAAGAATSAAARDAAERTPDAAATPAPPKARAPLKVRRVVLRSSHRVFQDFSQVDTVALKQEFPIGDTEFTARVIRFVPDFSIGRNRKIVSRTDEPRNPAFQIVVKEKGTPRDTSWAFLNFPPHFSMRALIAFQVLQIDFENRESLVNRALLDTTAAGGGKR